MAVMHRALFTWFIFLVFMVLLCLRLESRTHWNWFIIFLPMWVYDSILLIYVLFHLISHCKHGVEHIRSSLHKNILYVCAIVLKMAAQIVICLKLEYQSLNISIYHMLTPIWLLLPVIVTDVFVMLLKYSRY